MNMTISTSRQYAQFATDYIFVYINLLKQTNITNVAHLDKTSGEYLTVRLINNLLDDIEYLFKRKLFLTSGKKVVIKMTQAQGIAFYKVLLSLPIPKENYYFLLVRNDWVLELDQQILK